MMPAHEILARRYGIGDAGLTWCPFEPSRKRRRHHKPRDYETNKRTRRRMAAESRRRNRG